MHDVVSQFDQARKSMLVSQFAPNDWSGAYDYGNKKTQNYPYSNDYNDIQIAEKSDKIEVKAVLPIVRDSINVFPESTFLIIQGNKQDGKQVTEFISLPRRIEPDSVECCVEKDSIIITARVEESINPWIKDKQIGKVKAT